MATHSGAIRRADTLFSCQSEERPNTEWTTLIAPVDTDNPLPHEPLDPYLPPYQQRLRRPVRASQGGPYARWLHQQLNGAGGGRPALLCQNQ